MFWGVQTLLPGIFGSRVHLFGIVLFAVFCTALHGNTVDLTLLASSDLHGAATLIQQSIAPVVRQESAKASKSVIYVDIGDCAQGPLKLLLNRGSGILPELYKSGCSIFVPGNHELEYGFDAFCKLLDEFPGTILAANLYAPELAGRFCDNVIIEKNGIKIAFIGLMLKGMENSFPVSEKRFRTLPGKAVLRKTVNKVIAQGADVIVLLRHVGKYGGGENTYELIKDIPEIDLVIGAHNHKGDAGSMVGRVWYVQPPPYGRALAKVSMSFDRKLRRIKQIRSSFIELPHQQNESAYSSRKVTSWYGKSLDYPAELIQKKYNTDLAIYAVSSPQKLQTLLKIPTPSMDDFYSVFPYFDAIVKVKVTGGEFAAILREYAKFAHKRKQYLAKSGFTADIRRGKVHNIGTVAGEKSYTLVLSAYAAAGAGGNLMGVRRILKDKIDYQQLEKSPALLEILTEYGNGH